MSSGGSDYDANGQSQRKADSFNDNFTNDMNLPRLPVSAPVSLKHISTDEEKKFAAVGSKPVKRQKLDSDSVQRAISEAVDAAALTWFSSKPVDNHTSQNGSANAALQPAHPSYSATDIDIIQDDGIPFSDESPPSVPLLDTAHAQTLVQTASSDQAATPPKNGVDAVVDPSIVHPRPSRANSTTMDPKTEVVTAYKKLQVLPRLITSLPVLTPDEKAELELALQLNPRDPDDWWRDDWSGNLALMQKEISNPVIRRRKAHRSEVTQTLWEWAQSQHTHHGSNNNNTATNRALRLGRNLLALVSHQAPPAAQRILAYASWEWDQDPVGFDIFDALKRCSYDPAVLREDGWTTSPQSEFDGSASGGPKHIGKEICWEGFDAVVIAYVLDSEIGDLWKAMWLDAFETFDLEADELQKSIKKWERKYKKSYDKKENGAIETASSSTSARFAALKDFSVEGIEHGIILATTYNPNARPGVFWPARVLHVSELDKSQTLHKRNSAKQKVNIVFFAPYWLARGANALTEYPLFEMETIDVSEETIQKYPHDGQRGINIHQLRVGFRFTGLPKHFFGRYLDGHRIAMALKVYAQDQLMASSSNSYHATAALFDTHPLAINTARFPTSLLNLPFQYVLSKLQLPGKQKTSDDEEGMVEPTLQLAYMLKSMEPPRCFGTDTDAGLRTSADTHNGSHDKNNNSVCSMASPVTKPPPTTTDSSRLLSTNSDDLDVRTILSEYLEGELIKLAHTDLPSATLFEDLKRLVLRANRISRDVSNDRRIDMTTNIVKLKSLLQECLRMKVSQQSCTFPCLLSGV
jgi:hypothetical protein